MQMELCVQRMYKNVVNLAFFADLRNRSINNLLIPKEYLRYEEFQDASK